MELSKSNFQLEIIGKIKKIRLENNISQSQLSSIIEVSLGQVGNIESLKYPHKYTLKQIYIISKYFQFPIESLFLSENELTLPKEEIIDCLIIKLFEYDR